MEADADGKFLNQRQMRRTRETANEFRTDEYSEVRQRNISAAQKENTKLQYWHNYNYKIARPTLYPHRIRPSNV